MLFIFHFQCSNHRSTSFVILGLILDTDTDTNILLLILIQLILMKLIICMVAVMFIEMDVVTE